MNEHFDDVYLVRQPSTARLGMTHSSSLIITLHGHVKARPMFIVP